MQIPHPRFSKSLVRIIDNYGETHGLGFLVSKDIVCTCTHVVISALNLNPKTFHQVFTDFNITLDFPFLRCNKQKASIIKVIPITHNDGGDITFLRLDTAITEIFPRLHLHPQPPETNRVVEVFGYPKDFENGVWAEGIIKHSLPNGWFQIEDERTRGIRIHSGFSGSPVWDEFEGRIVGMIVGATRDEEARMAFFIQNTFIVEILADILLSPLDSNLKTVINFGLDSLSNNSSVSDDFIKEILQDYDLSLVDAASLFSNEKAFNLIEISNFNPFLKLFDIIEEIDNTPFVSSPIYIKLVNDLKDSIDEESAVKRYIALLDIEKKLISLYKQKDDLLYNGAIEYALNICYFLLNSHEESQYYIESSMKSALSNLDIDYEKRNLNKYINTLKKLIAESQERAAKIDPYLGSHDLFHPMFVKCVIQHRAETIYKIGSRILFSLNLLAMVSFFNFYINQQDENQKVSLHFISRTIFDKIIFSFIHENSSAHNIYLAWELSERHIHETRIIK